MQKNAHMKGDQIVKSFPPKVSTVVVACAMLIALVAVAAPVVPRRAQLRGDVRSLGKLNKIQLAIHPLPPQLEKRGISRQGIHKAWSTQLQRAGYEVVQDRTGPRLELKAMVVPGETTGLRGLYSYTLVLTVQQSASVTRLNEKLIVPTYVNLAVGFEAEAKLRQDVNDGLNYLVQEFINQASLASTTYR